MTSDFERKASADGLTFKLYRGEGVALLAFDLDEDKATDDFVGFTVEVKYPGANHWGALHNRLHFEYPPTPDTYAQLQVHRSAVPEVPLDTRTHPDPAGRVPLPGVGTLHGG